MIASISWLQSALNFFRNRILPATHLLKQNVCGVLRVRTASSASAGARKLSGSITERHGDKKQLVLAVESRFYGQIFGMSLCAVCAIHPVNLEKMPHM